MRRDDFNARNSSIGFGALRFETAQGFNAPSILKLRIVHHGAHRVRFHLVGRVRRQQLRQQIRVLELGVEPLLVVLRREDHRHPVVNGSNKLVRFSSDDRERLHLGTARRCPCVPQPGKAEWLFVLEQNSHGLFQL
jgi:hypothetical protein